MVQAQILNKILESKDISIVSTYNLTPEYFPGYEAEFDFVLTHYQKYKSVPDKETFSERFPDFQYFTCTESDKYLYDTITEELVYYRTIPILQQAAEIMRNGNSQDAVDYALSQLSGVSVSGNKTGIDIISQALLRFNEWHTKLTSDEPFYITTGFPELDEIITGWAKAEELGVIFARTGQGKSWVLCATLTHAWKIGNRVGYISPEMSPNKIGYRFDTLTRHFSNRNLVTGKEEVDYEKYINDLSNSPNPFIVATPNDFDKRVTVSKLRTFVQSNNLDILGIDGITYLTDERGKRGDNKTTSLTNISEDLMSLSLELQIPIIVVVQSNREGARDPETSGTPELENIRDSDGIAHNATKVISIRQTGAGLEMALKKNRDGRTGDKLVYVWDIDHGQFTYIPGENDNQSMPVRQNQTNTPRQTSQPHTEPTNTAPRRTFTDGSDPF